MRGQHTTHSVSCMRRAVAAISSELGAHCAGSPTTKSVAWCSTSDWSAPDRSGLLRLDASSIQTGPDRSRRHGHATAQDQRAARFHHSDVQPHLRVELDLVPDGDGLPFGDDLVGVVDVAAD